MKRAFLRYLLRCLPVCSVLALIGLGYGMVLYNVLNPAPFGFSGTEDASIQVAATEPRPNTSQILWRVPVGMAFMGMVMVALLEAIGWWVRRQKKRFLDMRLASTVAVPPVHGESPEHTHATSPN